MGGASKFLMLLSTPFPLLYPRPSALRLARHSRLSIASISTAAQNRILSSDYRPRLGLSVRAAEQVHTQASVREDYAESVGSSLPNSRTSHPWPEWSKLVDHLAAGGYSDRQVSVAAGDDDDSFSVYEDLPEEFAKAAELCLSFARNHPDMLRLLPKKDIEVIVENGSPFLFKNGMNSAKRMRLFLSSDGTDVPESDIAHTIDVMRYLLSYACNPLVASDKNNLKASELVEASIRNLLSAFVNVSGTVLESNHNDSTPRKTPLRYEQFSGPPGRNIEMKRGDWICGKCSFMNFARNPRCLECNEGRPNRQLTGGEWECPQCDFFNYGRNMSCLRCDCKRPGETSFRTAAPDASSGFGRKSSIEQILNKSNTDKSEIERRLAENDEKAERWFSKVSQLDDASDLSSAVADEDFPEIMPLRKGVNRFVVSNRKTPLERRLANAQYRRDLGNDGSVEGSDSQSGGLGGTGSDKTSESSISKTLDRILGRSTATSGTDHQPAAGETNTGGGTRFNSSEYRQSVANQRRDPGYVPFVPLPADMFSKSQKPIDEVSQSLEKEESASVKTSLPTDSVSGSSESGKNGDVMLSEKLNNPAESKNDKESSDASEKWFKKVAELHDVTDLASAIPDEDFPEIMPMRKGENRFVVSKKKDRSLTSPQYKRRLAMEQANSSNFVPFVPFPPDYFAKKDKQPEGGISTERAAPETSASASSSKVDSKPEKFEENKASGVSNWGVAGNISQQPENPLTNSENSNTLFSGKNLNDSKVDAGYGGAAANSAQQPNNLRNGGFSQSAFRGVTPTGSSSQQADKSQNARESWNSGYSGKSLEGSAVKEPDPLDMSEEAKAERWFRRVAQITDISELSKIPDEDFPEIMPMRKGVNRFVVSKRKTPLERRLTSPQYRRNLPIISSEPEKDSNQE